MYNPSIGCYTELSLFSHPAAAYTEIRLLKTELGGHAGTARGVSEVRMKEIRVWQVVTDKQLSVIPLESIGQTSTEALLEEILVHRPDLLLKDLKLVGRQTETAGGPLDLLGVDGDGQLVVFELKRGTLTREAVAQIIDYASYLSELDPEELSSHISERSGKNGIEKIDNFLTWYQEQFAKSLSRPQKPRLILVGLGADDTTRRIVSFLAESDIDISLITFHAFDEAGRILLARQLEVEAKPLPGASSITKIGNLEALQERIVNLRVGGFYNDMARFFQDHLAAYQWPNQTGYSYYLPELTESGSESNHVFVSLYLNDSKQGQTQVLVHPRAVDSAGESFKSVQEVLGGRLKLKQNRSAELWITSAQEWSESEPAFEKLCAAIVAGWKKRREQLTSSEMQVTASDNEK
jgi:hypothetical protein